MKNVRYIFCALALLMCTTAAATKVTDSNQFTATFDGAKKVTFKVLVRCADEGGGGDNLMYQVDMANTFKEGQLSTTNIDRTTHLYCVVYNNNVKETTRNLLYYGTFDRGQNTDYANFPQVVSEAGTGWLAVTKPAGNPDYAGVFKITNAIKSQMYETVRWGDNTNVQLREQKSNGFTQHALQWGSTYSENKIMEGEWEMPDCFVGKKVELHMYGVYYDNVNNFKGVYDKTLGTFIVQRDKNDPTLSEPFFYPMNENGDPLVGKIGTVYSSMLSNVTYKGYYGSQIFVGSEEEGSGIVTVDATDTLTSLKMDIYGTDMTDTTVKKTLATNYVFVKPLHRIYDFYVKPYVTADGVDRNYNQLTWTIRHSNIEDIGPDDVFLIQRSTRANFADAEDLPALITLPKSKGTDTTLTFVDSTFSGSLPEGKKLYYRITRGYAAVWEWSQEAFDKNYWVKDSIGNHVLLWSLYDSPNDDIAPLEITMVDGVSAMVRINLSTPEVGEEPVNYVWDKRAKLLLTRTNLTTGEVSEINLLTNSQAVMSNCQDAPNRRAIWSYKYLDGLHPCSDYRFSVRIDDSECTILPRKDALMEYADSLIYSTEDIPVVINGFNAAKSESKNYVLLSWQNDPSSVDAFYLDYREKGTTDWKSLAQVTDENYYEDYAADPGVTYEYRIHATYTCYGTEKTTASDTASGWLYPYGSISGTVIMPNGTGIQGVTVLMVSDTIDGKVYSYQVTTDMNGHYQYDSLVYIATGTTYMVSVPSTDVNYVSSTTGEGSVNVTLNPHDADKTNYSFQPDKFYSVTGRVLYYNTSVPVAYAEFEMQLGDTLAQPLTMMNTSGEPIRSDLNGYFTLQVPTNLRTLRVKKEGHTFVQDGYLIMEGRKDLALTDDLREIRFYDLTKAHILGRVSAGVLESVYPLGTDSSTNRLGDDITIVLELEGDKISQLVNDPNDLSRATFDTVIVHQHAWDKPGEESLFKTVENTTRKRVTIHADNRSGEFRAELLPVRYKIVEMSATGYASLLDPDQAMPILDLTQSIDTPYEYNYVYHSTPVISYKQTKYGIMLPFYGEEGAILCGIDTATAVALVTLPDSSMKRCQSVSEKIEGVHYLLGYPLFAQQSYGMKVGVYEPYYYNNDPQTSALYSVPLQGELKVYNNMTSKMTTATYPLNMRGETSFNFVCDNVSFTRTGENALRTLNMSFTFNGKSIQSEPLQGYVMGSQDIEGGVMQKLGENIILDDILRDPYGAGSYATLDAGTKYSTNYHEHHLWNAGFDFSVETNPKITFDFLTGLGFMKRTKIQFGVGVAFGVSYRHVNERDHNYTYSYTTSSSISTSSGTTKKDIGAEADVYIGHSMTVGYVKKMEIKMADSLTVALYASNITKGNAHIITQGCDSTGKPFYLMVAEVIEPVVNPIESQFVYSQYHILKTIIPDLTRKRNDLIARKPAPADSAFVAEQLQARANELKQVQYLSLVPDEDPNFAKDGYYKTFVPTTDLSITDAYKDEVMQYNQLIFEWQEMIKANEQLKASIAITGKDAKTYDLSSGASANYSETSDIQHSHYKYDYNSVSIGLKPNGIGSPASGEKPKNNGDGGQGGEQGAGGQGAGGQGAGGQGEGGQGAGGQAGEGGEQGDGGEGQGEGGEQGDGGEGQGDGGEGQGGDDGKTKTTTVKLPTGDLTIQLTFAVKPDIQATSTYVETESFTRKVSYHLGTDNFSSINQTVYRVTNDSWKTLANGDPQSWWSEAYNKSEAEQAESPVNDFVFVLNGGATGCPWIGPDSAHFLNNTQLSAGTLKLDKPTITLDRYEQSDIPADEAAIFTVALANESEQLTGKSTAFNLIVSDGTNPNGLSVSIDGQPIGAGRQFYLDAGQSMTKVIEVRRGNGYDFENVELRFFSSCDMKMSDAVRFSVHYVPVASPVTVSAPDDKWVLNTLSEKDADGFYLPVTISGFDINYDNFDHLEFQYKLSTEGESKWVNLCSYYANDSLYKVATGNREMIKSTGKIEGIHFYGERDPIEQHYDLRAVSFSRYGNGFITRTSPVVSGIKDTRVPDVFGKTSPTSGILTYEDDIRINFSEDIAGQYLDKDNNFQVLGATNSVSIETGTSLFFPGLRESKALSRTTRSLNGTDFTIDMMVQAEDDVNMGQLFALSDKVEGMENVIFGFTVDEFNVRRLYAWINGTFYLSEKIPTTLRTFQRLALEYRKDNVENPVTFRMNTGYLDEDLSRRVTVGDYANMSKSGRIALGEMFLGRIMEVRLWNKVLTVDEYGNTQAVRLTGYEHGLLAYWPLDEGGTANVSQDKAHGNHLDLTGLSWQMPEGCSLYLTEKTKNNPVRLSDKLVTTNSASDYTIMFWWKSDVSADTVALFSTGRGLDEYKGLFIGVEHGRIVVLGDGVKISGASLIGNNEWHHFTMTVNRSQNLVNVYVDEQLVAQKSATGFPGISGTPVLGSCVWSKKDHGGPGETYSFKGHIDFFSLWKAALPLDFISQYAHHAPSGEEIALQAHLQLHRKYLNPNGIYEIAPSVFNEVCKRDEATGKIAVEANMNKDTLLLCDANLLAAMWDKSVYAPVQESQKMGKLNYQYKAKDDQLLIELTDPEKQINKQQVYISVREVEDLNGNPIASAVTVPVFVDLNRIRWSDYSIERTINLAEEDVFFATIINRCGSNKQYTITTDADWLECSSTSGQLSPKEERTFYFTVSDGLNPGTYSTIAYITDEMGLSEPLLVNVTILADEPEWDVDKSNKDATASLYGQVRIKLSEDNYVFDMDERDIIGAFVGPECIGNAHVKTDNDGHSDLFITLYGNETIQGQLVSFSLWRATTGISYKLVTESDLYYQSGGCYGCEGTPVILSTTDQECEQLISLNPGWNWASICLNMDAKSTLDNSLYKTTTFQVGDEIKCSHDQVSAQRVNEVGAYWRISNGDKMILNEQNVYAIKTRTGGDIAWHGSALPDSLRKVVINAGGAWCQLPYLCETTQSVTNALTSYFQSATAGDIVKGYDQFAIFTADKRWVGSLEYMRPGQGYYIKSASIYPVTITYVNNDNLYRTPKKTAAKDQAQDAYGSDVTRGQYNMPIVATAEGVELEQGDLLRAFSDDVCVGEAVMTSDSLFFITVYDGTTDDLSFEIVRNGIGVAKSGKKADIFSPNGSLGTYETPYIINFEQVDDQSTIRKEMIDGILYIYRNGEVYNAQGTKL